MIIFEQNLITGHIYLVFRKRRNKNYGRYLYRMQSDIKPITKNYYNWLMEYRLQEYAHNYIKLVKRQKEGESKHVQLLDILIMSYKISV